MGVTVQCEDVPRLGWRRLGAEVTGEAGWWRGVDGGGDTAGLGPLASPPRPTWSRPRQRRPGRRSPCCARLLGLGTPGEIFTED